MGRRLRLKGAGMDKDVLMVTYRKDPFPFVSGQLMMSFSARVRPEACAVLLDYKHQRLTLSKRGIVALVFHLHIMSRSDARYRPLSTR
jgi:hypothetical protein